MMSLAMIGVLDAAGRLSEDTAPGPVHVTDFLCFRMRRYMPETSLR